MKVNKNKNFLFPIFITVNVIFIFLQIHKQSNLIKLYFEKQKIENEKKFLTQEKNNLLQEFYEKRNPTAIRNFAISNLNMEKMKLSQINKLKLNE